MEDQSMADFTTQEALAQTSLGKRRAELYGEIAFASIAPRMLRSKRKKLDTDGCLDADSHGARSGDIANAGFLV